MAAGMLAQAAGCRKVPAHLGMQAVHDGRLTLAELRGWTADEAARRTHANAREVCDQSGWRLS